MNSLDALETDVGGRRRTGDEDQRLSGARGRLEALEELRHRLDHLIPCHDADVEVGDERDRAPALTRPAVERDRSGIRTGNGARRDRGVQGIELRRRQPVILDESDARRAKRGREIGRDDDA